MKPSKHLPVVVLIPIFLISLIIGQLGCAHAPKAEPPTLSEEVKAQLGTIGAVSASFQPTFTSEKPMNKKEAATTSAEAGALGCLQVGVGALGAAPDGDPMGAAAAVVIGLGAIALTPVGAAIGGIVGAVRGVNETETNEAESVLNRALVDFDIQRNLRDHILSVAQEKTSYPFIPFEDRRPGSLDEEVSYCLGMPPEVVTILEVTVLEFGLSSFSHGPGINPPLSLFMIAKVSMVRVSDDEELYQFTFRSESKEKKKFTKWAGIQGQPLKDGLEQCLDSLAGQIVTTVFGLQGDKLSRNSST